MPKKVIKQKPGEAIAEPVKRFLLTQFQIGEIDKFETLGGVIEILLSTTPRGVKRRTDLTLDSMYLMQLTSISHNSDELKRELLGLTRKQLRIICAMLSLPAPANLNKRDLMRSIENHIKSSDSWGAIIGNHNELE